MLTKTLLALTLVTAVAEPLKLARTFAEGTSRTYEISAKDKTRGGELSGKLTLKALGATKDGKTDVQISGKSSMKGPSGESNDADVDSKWTIDQNGLPTEIVIQDGEVLGAILALASYIPGKEVEIGKEFPTDWKSGDKVLSGTGTVKSIEEKDGKKIAVVSLKMKFVPGDESPGTLDLESRFDVADGSLLSSTGKIDVENEASFELVIKEAK